MICPKCNKEIFHLIKREKVIQEAYVFLDAWGYLSYEQKDDYIEEQNMGFRCPECNVRLFLETEKARKFLKGEYKCRKS